MILSLRLKVLQLWYKISILLELLGIPVHVFIFKIIYVTNLSGLTLAYSTVLSCADARGERIRSNYVISSHFMDVIMYNQNCRYIGKDYIRIMCKHILSSPYHCSNVPALKWMGWLITYYIKLKCCFEGHFSVVCTLSIIWKELVFIRYV